MIKPIITEVEFTMVSAGSVNPVLVACPRLLNNTQHIVQIINEILITIWDTSILVFNLGNQIPRIKYDNPIINKKGMK